MIIVPVSAIITLTFICCGRWLFRKLHLLDRPELYGHQRQAIPYGVGIVFFLSFLIGSLLWLETSPQLITLLVGGGILTTTCFIDDRCQIPAWLRLLIQLFCAALIVQSGVHIPAISNPFGDPIVLDGIRWSLELGGFHLNVEPMAATVAILWIVFLVNAMNWLDGAPGIVSGISTISCAVIYLLATMKGLHVIDQSQLANMALILGGSTFVFLFFDFPKPKVLMGDSGAMFLGLMIAVMAIYSGGKLATAFIVLAFPLLDAVWTIVRRIVKGQSPLRGDLQHFHHELLRAGLSERQVNLFYYALSLGFGLSTLYLESLGKLIAIIILFGLMVSIRTILALR
ncbi:MAG: MraY family glycosyltransferase [bacterium]|nr:MraY family glycosyltransferase [bacterium]